MRIVRVLRFAAKLGFTIEPATREPIDRMAPLLSGVPVSRLFDEMVKLNPYAAEFKKAEQAKHAAGKKRKAASGSTRAAKRQFYKTMTQEEAE